MATDVEKHIIKALDEDRQIIEEHRELVASLCRDFFSLGWVSGTGGSISMRVIPPEGIDHHRWIVMAPSGVQKERMQPDDIFVLDRDGEIAQVPVTKPPPAKPPKLSECSPLFMKAYTLRNAGAVMHSHSLHAVLATVLDPKASEFKVTQLEMVKGIAGHGYYDTLTVPIIENTARECELTDRLGRAIEQYPKSCAVLVRNHGVYIWGDNWAQAKTQSECYHFLFEAAVALRRMGIDPSQSGHPHVHAPFADARLIHHAEVSSPVGGAHASDALVPASKRRRVGHSHAKWDLILLDIEGTTTPISFVMNCLFPYSEKNAEKYLMAHWEDPEVQKIVDGLAEQVEEDARTGGVPGEPLTIPPRGAPSLARLSAVVAAVHSMIANNRKVTPLKDLQGAIWHDGYQAGAILGELFADVPEALAKWQEQGIKMGIYSSGSRPAQRLLFRYSQRGDLTPYLSAYFDTRIGHKQESQSYAEICETMGFERETRCNVLFCTDILEEASAAKAAGLDTVIVIRPGNKPLPASHGHRTVTSLLDV
eukprot:jgi/Mesvir1/24308/Mv10996-RA.1